MTLNDVPRKSREQIAVEKEHRLKMCLAVKNAITDNQTRNGENEMFPDVTKYSQFNILLGVEGDRNVKRRTARLQALYNSIGSGFSMQHVLWVSAGLESVGVKWDSAADKITPESLKAHRSMHLEAMMNVSPEDATLVASWALSNGPEFMLRASSLAMERQVFDQKTLEEIMNGSAAVSLAEGVL